MGGSYFFLLTYILIYQITILVAAEGQHKLPTINGSGDLKEALQKLGTIPSNKLLVRSNYILLVLLLVLLHFFGTITLCA